MEQVKDFVSVAHAAAVTGPDRSRDTGRLVLTVTADLGRSRDTGRLVLTVTGPDRSRDTGRLVLTVARRLMNPAMHLRGVGSAAARGLAMCLRLIG
jgi:hypothetical protein